MSKKKPKKRKEPKWLKPWRLKKQLDAECRAAVERDRT